MPACLEKEKVYFSQIKTQWAAKKKLHGNMYQVFTEIYRGIKRAHKTATDCIADGTGIENLRGGQSDKNHNKIQWWR
jgi:hypothetical protein